MYHALLETARNRLYGLVVPISSPWFTKETAAVGVLYRGILHNKLQDDVEMSPAIPLYSILEIHQE